MLVLINYDFVEIGTSCFKTEIQKATNKSIGLSVEPLQIYLDKLPNKPFVKKVCAAIIPDESYRDLKLYYVAPEDIEKYKLETCLLGCNSLGKPHPLHINYHYDIKMWHENFEQIKNETINLVDKELVKTIEIRTYTFEELVIEYNIGYINYLKIDIEGLDCKLVNSILNFYDKNLNYFLPKQIQFETNTHTSDNEIEETYEMLVSKNYKIKRNLIKGDTLAILKG